MSFICEVDMRVKNRGMTSAYKRAAKEHKESLCWLVANIVFEKLFFVKTDVDD